MLLGGLPLKQAQQFLGGRQPVAAILILRISAQALSRLVADFTPGIIRVADRTQLQP